MNIAAKFNSAACGAALVGSLTFCLADDRPALALITIPIVIAGWFCGMGERTASGERRPIALPRLLVNLLVLGAIIHAAMRAGGARSVGQPIVSHLGEFLIYVLLLKLFDRRTVRDESQMLTLSVFVTIAAVLTSNNLLTGVGVAVFTPLAIVATMLYQLKSGRARAAEGRTRTDERDIATTEVESKRGFSRQLAQTALLCVLTAAFIGGVIFIFTPRGLGVGALGQFGQPRAMVGFDDHIDLGRSGMLNESATPVMDVALHDEDGNNLGSTLRTLYLRGFTRDEYDAGSYIWVRSKTSFENFDFATASKTVFPLGEIKDWPRNNLVQRVTIRPSISGESYIFSSWRPLSIRTSDPTTGKLAFDHLDGTIKRPRAAHSTFTYTVESSESALRTELEPTSRLGFQSGPVHDLAVSILQERGIEYPLNFGVLSVPRSVALAFRDFLRKSCTYTLDLWAPEESRDPLEMFLFEKKTGHCQYFASALVAMCQSVGLHARVVGGFVATEYNSITGTYLVRQSNAHAWVEFHVGGGAWATTDPTPSADLDRIHRSTSGWLAAVRRWWDTLEFGWNRSIVSFDSNRQSTAIGRRAPSEVSGWFARMSDRLTRGLSGREARALIPEWAFYIVPAIMLLITVTIVTNRLSRARLARTLRLRPREPDPELRSLLTNTGFYGQALRALERAGPDLAKPDDRPPLAHADQLATRDSTLAQALKSIGETYYAVRFGRHTLTSEQAGTARHALDTMRTALRAGATGKHGKQD